MMAFLEINNIKYSGWESIKIIKSIETLTGAFQIRMTNLWDDAGDTPIVKVQNSCKVKLGNSTVIDGYIDNIRIQYNSVSDELIVMGRDKSSDLVDCSAANGTGEYKNLKIEKIIQELCEPFGINVIADIDTGDTVPTFNVDQGETVHNAIQQLCTLRAALAIFDNDSNLIITRAGNKKTPTALIDGKNVLSAIAQYDFTERFSDYTVKGQTQFNKTITVVESTEAKAVIKDPNVLRYRPMLIIGDGEMDDGKAATRAKWEASIREGKSQVWEFTVSKWVDDDDVLWQPNHLVTVESQILDLYVELLIVKVEYILDEQGEKTKLTLMPQSAFELIPGELLALESDFQKYIQGVS